MKKCLIYIVDDDKMFINILTDHLKEKKLHFRMELEILTYPVSELCIDNLHRRPDIVILDYNMDSKFKDAENGKKALEQILHESPNTRVIMASSQDDLKTAVDLINSGAYDYFIKDESFYYRVTNAVAVIINQLMKNDLENKYRKNSRMIATLLGAVVILQTAVIAYLVTK
jgi:two-component system, OmpR family, response regulator